MSLCCAYNCSYIHFNKKSGKTIHKFPFSRPELLLRWILNIRRANWYPRKHTNICSDHFTEDCFNRSGARVKLVKDAVPTIFNFSPSDQITSNLEQHKLMPEKETSKGDISKPEIIYLPSKSTISEEEYTENKEYLLMKLEEERKIIEETRKRRFPLLKAKQILKSLAYTEHSQMKSGEERKRMEAKKKEKLALGKDKRFIEYLQKEILERIKYLTERKLVSDDTVEHLKQCIENPEFVEMAKQKLAIVTASVNLRSKVSPLI